MASRVLHGTLGESFFAVRSTCADDPVDHGGMVHSLLLRSPDGGYPWRGNRGATYRLGPQGDSEGWLGCGKRIPEPASESAVTTYRGPVSS